MASEETIRAQAPAEIKLREAIRTRALGVMRHAEATFLPSAYTALWSALAAEVADAGGVQYVPALLGLGTPYWDYGARGTLVGMSLGTDRRHICRAVLEGVAWRVAECVAAVAADTAAAVTALHVDGGAARSDVLCTAIADRSGVPVLRSTEREATAYGCGLLAGVAAGMWDLEAVAALPSVERTFDPGWDATRKAEARFAWDAAVSASRGWIEGLSQLAF